MCFFSWFSSMEFNLSLAVQGTAIAVNPLEWKRWTGHFEEAPIIKVCNHT